MLKKIIKTAADGGKDLVLDTREMAKAEKKSLGLAVTEQMVLDRISICSSKDDGVWMESDKVALSDTILKEVALKGLSREIKEQELDLLYGEDLITGKVIKGKNVFEGIPEIIVLDASGCQEFGDVAEDIKEAEELTEADMNFLAEVGLSEIKPQAAAAALIMRDVHLLFSEDGEIKDISFCKKDGYTSYEVMIMTPAGQKKGRAYSVRTDFRQTEEEILYYREEVRPFASELYGMEAMINRLTNGWFGELRLSESKTGKREEFVLSKVIARFGLVMSGGIAKDITKLGWRFQQVGSVKLPIDEVRESMEVWLTWKFGEEESPKKTKTREIFEKYYKEIKGDGQCFIRASAMAKYEKTINGQNEPFKAIERRCVGKAYIMRALMHLKDKDGVTGFAINKGLMVVMPDEIFDAVPAYIDCDVLLTGETVKMITCDGGIEKVWMQICRESKTENSSNTNSQALAMLEGNMAEMGSIEAIKLAEEIIIGKAKNFILASKSGFMNSEDCLAALNMFEKKPCAIRKAPLERFIGQILNLDGEIAGAPPVRKAYGLAAIKRIQSMQNGRMNFDGSFEMGIEDPLAFFPTKERFSKSKKLAFGRPVYNISLKLEDMLLRGSMETWKKGTVGLKVITRNPIQAPGQVFQADFISDDEFANRINEFYHEKAWKSFFNRFEGMIFSGASIWNAILGGADNDGDIFLIFYDDEWNKLVTRTRVPCIARDSEIPAKKEFLDRVTMKKFMAGSLKANAVGILSNWASTLRDIENNILGGYKLPSICIAAIEQMKSNAKEALIKDPNSQWVEAMTAWSSVNTNSPASIMRAIEKSFVVIATLVMQEIDSSKTGVGVNPNNFNWLKPAYKQGKTDILVVPNFFPYSTGVARKVENNFYLLSILKQEAESANRFDVLNEIEEIKASRKFTISQFMKICDSLRLRVGDIVPGVSFAKRIYQSNSPLGKLTRLVLSEEKNLQEALSKSLKGDPIFRSEMEGFEELFDLFIDKAEEYSKAASAIMDKYDGEPNVSRTEELVDLASDHRQFWKGYLSQNNIAESDLCAVIDEYCLVVGKEFSRWENIYPIEVLGGMYVSQVRQMVNNKTKHLVKVKMFETGYQPDGKYLITSGVVYKDGVAIGKTKSNIADGKYELKKLGSHTFVSKKVDPSNKWVGHTFRIFGTKSLDVTAEVLKSGIKANDGIVKVRNDFANAIVEIGALRAKLGDNEAVVGGHTFKVEVIDEKAMSLTLKVLEEV